MRRLLVTGGGGFIGANFVHYWRRTYPADCIVVLDALTYAGNLMSLKPLARGLGFRFIHGNICDTDHVESILREEGLSTIVHFAAESHVDRSIAGPDSFIETNIVGTHSLLKAARRAWIQSGGELDHRFHHVSTDEVYGALAPTDPAFTESTRIAPNSPYSASKAASDHLVRAYGHTYGLQTTTSNCSNNYGPYQFPEKLIPLMIVNILQGRSLPVYGDGLHVRDWLHVEDHCRGIDAILQKGISGEVYNLGGRYETPNLKLVELLCGIADELFHEKPGLTEQFPDAPGACGESARTLIKFVDDRPGHDRRYAVDCTKAERDLGFAPLTTINAGLRATFEWYVANEEWWRAIADGSYRNARL